MLYEIAHIIRDKFDFLWEMVESVNGWLFACRYRNRLKGVNGLLATLNSEYTVRQTTEADVKPLVQFFKEQPEDAFEFFKPHGFDEKSIKEELLASVEDPIRYNDEVIYPDKVRLNLYYYNHYSFWTDIKMIFATVLGKRIEYAGEVI